MKAICFALMLCLLGNICHSQANTDYYLWMPYAELNNKDCKRWFKNVYVDAGKHISSSIKNELEIAIPGLLNREINFYDYCSKKTTLIIAKIDQLPDKYLSHLKSDLSGVNDEGFAIRSFGNRVVVSSVSNRGLLYGTYRLLREIQLSPANKSIQIIDQPKLQVRLLNHWDNLDGTVERGYAGSSIFKWHRLPGYIDQRYTDYARANASIGINGTVLTNVNSNALILTPQYLKKIKALADVFRNYGIQVYLTARFSAPIEIGGLETADPLAPEVIKWWETKVKEIYSHVPDFGGFLVKANSEGQPGPQNYDRNHVDGANMLAKALQPHRGIVMWRAFVYSEFDHSDRAKQAFAEFVPFDGQFEENVLIQVKNGAIDFQPREPFHPMFGAMPNTPLMMEFQITQEYLGFSTHLVFLPKLYEEVLTEDTKRHGTESTVSDVIQGKFSNNSLSGMAGVSNIGSDLNWTGHPMNQANWYGFGRLAWNPDMTSEQIAREWIVQTFGNNQTLINALIPLLVKSRETVVKYMTPLGLHHIMGTDHHYGPQPWENTLSRPEWNPVYYHKADANGIGFDRTSSGSQATQQYASELAEIFEDVEGCPEKYLLWFHHLNWDYKMKNNRTLWENLCLTYQEGVDESKQMISTWKGLKSEIDQKRYNEILILLKIQQEEAIWWKDACLTYFQSIHGLAYPSDITMPAYDLEHYKSLQFPFAPGIKPKW